MSPERFLLSVGPGHQDASPTPRWRSVLDLGARLPGGLVHAERITVLPEAPDYLTPLSPGSRWYALGHGLVVACTSGNRAGLLADLHAYRDLAGRVRDAFTADAAPGLEAPTLTPELTLRLGALLEAGPDELAAVDARAPGLRSDLAWMLRRGFDPEVVVHPALSEARQVEAGQAVAEALLSRVPAGRFHLLVSDDPLPLELLSPYAEDLGHSLYAWGRENPQRLRWSGLADALADSADAPERDLAALVAQDLLAWAPAEIREERRANEATQGLWLEDAWDATFGVCELSLLEAADLVVRHATSAEVLAVVLGGSDTLRSEAMARLAASGRLEGLGIVARAKQTGATPLVPEAIVWDDDAIRLELGAGLAKLAQKGGLPVRRIGALEAGPDRGAPIWVARVLRGWRRARITGALDAQAKPVLALAPGAESTSLSGVQVCVNAARIVISGLLDEDLPNRSGAGKARTSGRDGGLSRRFRA